MNNFCKFILNDCNKFIFFSQEPERDSVLRRLVRAVSRWDINSKRNINYRSFEPIIRLLSVSSTPECQLWATWALANLTQVS